MLIVNFMLDKYMKTVSRMNIFSDTARLQKEGIGLNSCQYIHVLYAA